MVSSVSLCVCVPTGHCEEHPCDLRGPGECLILVYAVQSQLRNRRVCWCYVAQNDCCSVYKSWLASTCKSHAFVVTNKIACLDRNNFLLAATSNCRSLQVN